MCPKFTNEIGGCNPLPMNHSENIFIMNILFCFSFFFQSFPNGSFNGNQYNLISSFLDVFELSPELTEAHMVNHINEANNKEFLLISSYLRWFYCR